MGQEQSKFNKNQPSQKTNPAQKSAPGAAQPSKQTGANPYQKDGKNANRK